MKILKDLGSVVISVTAFSFALMAVAWGLRRYLSFAFEGLNPTVTAAIVAAVATTTVTMVTVFVGRRLERRSATESQIRASKTPVYTEFVSVLMGPLTKKADSQAGDAADPAMVERMRKIMPGLILWASDDVMSKWSAWRKGASTLAPGDSMLQLEELLRAIRKDFGHSDRNLEEGDILGLFVKDIDEFLAERKQVASGQGRLSDVEPDIASRGESEKVDNAAL